MPWKRLSPFNRFYQPEQLILRGGPGQMKGLAIDSDFLTGPPLIPHVDGRGRVVSHQDSGKAGRYSVILPQLQDFLGHF